MKCKYLDKCNEDDKEQRECSNYLNCDLYKIQEIFQKSNVYIGTKINKLEVKLESWKLN